MSAHATANFELANTRVSFWDQFQENLSSVCSLPHDLLLMRKSSCLLSSAVLTVASLEYFPDTFTYVMQKFIQIVASITLRRPFSRFDLQALCIVSLWSPIRAENILGQALGIANNLGIPMSMRKPASGQDEDQALWWFIYLCNTQACIRNSCPHPMRDTTVMGSKISQNLVNPLPNQIILHIIMGELLDPFMCVGYLEYDRKLAYYDEQILKFPQDLDRDTLRLHAYLPITTRFWHELSRDSQNRAMDHAVVLASAIFDRVFEVGTQIRGCTYHTLSGIIMALDTVARLRYYNSDSHLLTIELLENEARCRSVLKNGRSRELPPAWESVLS